jgi:hypothetical protein
MQGEKQVQNQPFFEISRNLLPHPHLSLNQKNTGVNNMTRFYFWVPSLFATCSQQ